MFSNQCCKFCVIQQCIDWRNRDMWVDPRQGVTGGFHLWLPDRGITVQRLALQIGERNRVEVEQRQVADTGACQILRCRTAEATKPHHQHARILQRFLTVKIKTTQDDLPVVAQHLLIAEFCHYRPPNNALNGSTSTHSPTSTLPRSRSSTIKQLPRLKELNICEP